MNRLLVVSLAAFVLVSVSAFVAAQDSCDKPQRVSLNVRPVEGTHYKVREIEWWNLKAVSFEQVKSVSPLQVDDVLDMSKVRETLEAVCRLYAANGYVHASIVPKVRFLGQSAVSVRFKVSEGAQSP